MLRVRTVLISLLGLLAALPAPAQPRNLRNPAEAAAIHSALSDGDPFSTEVPVSYPAGGGFEQIGRWVRDRSFEREVELLARLDEAIGRPQQCSLTAGTLRPEVLPLAEWSRLISRCRHDLDSDDSSGRLAALRFLDTLGEACNRRPVFRSALPDDLLPAAGACLSDPNSDVRFLAMDQLERWAYRMLPDRSAVLPFLCDALRHPDPATREGAARVLARRLEATDPPPLGPHGPETVEVLLRALDAAEPDARYWFILPLGQTRASGAAAVPRLCSLLDDTDQRTRSAALIALRSLGPVARDAVPALVRHLSAGDDSSRDLAAAAIGAIGPGAAGAVPALISALDDPFTFVRWRAARSLGAIGPAASAALPRLRRAVAEQPDELGQCGAKAIAQIECWPSDPEP